MSGSLPAGRLGARVPAVDTALVAGTAASVVVVLAVLAGLASASSAHRLIQVALAAFLVVVSFRWLLGASVLFLVVTFPVTLPASLGAGASISKPFGLVLACSCALALIRERGRPLLFRDRPALSAFLVGYLVWGALSLLWTASIGATEYNAKRLLQAVLLVVVLYTVAQTRRDLIVLISGFVASSVIWSIYALSTGTVVAGGRLTGGINDPNYLASELVLAIVLGAFLLGTATHFKIRLLLVAAVGIDLGAFLLTQSRGGTVGLCVGVLAAIGFAGRTRGVVVAVTAVTIALTVGYVAIVAPAQVRHRVTDFSTSHTSGRSDSWQIAWKITEHHPIEGVALGGFRDEQLKYVASSIDIQYIGQILNDRLVVHNTYLETLTELGIVGFVLFSGVLVIAIFAAARTIRAASPGDANMLRGLLAGSIGMLAAFFFVSAEYEKPLWIAVALLAASSTTLARDGGRVGRSATGTLQPVPAAAPAATDHGASPRS